MDSVLGCGACSEGSEREHGLEREFSGQGAGVGSRTPPGPGSALPGTSRVNLALVASLWDSDSLVGK